MKWPLGHVDTANIWSDSDGQSVIDKIDWIGADVYPVYPSRSPESHSIMWMKSLEAIAHICKARGRYVDLKVQEVRWYEQIKGHVKLLSFLPYLKELSLHPPPKQMTTLKTGQLGTLRLNFSGDIERFWFPKEVFDTTSFDLNQYSEDWPTGNPETEFLDDVERFDLKTKPRRAMDSFYRLRSDVTT